MCYSHAPRAQPGWQAGWSIAITRSTTERAPKPKWRNGRRGGFKIRYSQGCEGSSPSFGTTNVKSRVTTVLLDLDDTLSDHTHSSLAGLAALRETYTSFAAFTL